jgi:class 3 adenylate cyclase/CheY-like chemotaxis protein
VSNSRIIESPERVPDWLPVGQQLIGEIVHLFSVFNGQGTELLDSDIAKLLNIANKLEIYLQPYRSGKTAVEHRKVWHDLRNMIGSIQGYSELILEETTDQNVIIDPLRSITSLCNRLLDLDTERPTPAKIIKAVDSKTKAGTILIVDDQEESREILRRYLHQHKHTVLEAESGKQMFDVLENDSKNVDLILLDLILYEMDGYELLLQLKHHPKLRAIPVIVVSGDKDMDRVIRCIEAGAEDYLFKPSNPVLLQARISAGIERKRWHDKEQQYRLELERNQRFIRGVFGRYLSNEIVDTLLENPDGLDFGGSSRMVTVMMADIRGFTSIAEKLPPHRVVKLLNNYLGEMTDIIMEHNGTVDEFIGDAILTIFGAPISRHDDTDRAIACALEMQHSMPRINAMNVAENLPEIEMGISLHTGLVVAGNIGSKKRAKYGVVGHTVNQTARIEEVCPAGSILISESTLNHSQSFLSIGSSTTINAKGILKAISIFELSAMAPREKN